MTLALILAFVAAWRLSRLATTDYLLDRPRRWAAGTAPDGEPGDGDDLRPLVGYLLTCPWCVSIWLSPLVVVPAVWFPDNRLVLTVLGCLVASAAAGTGAVLEAAVSPPDDE